MPPGGCQDSAQSLRIINACSKAAANSRISCTILSGGSARAAATRMAVSGFLRSSSEAATINARLLLILCLASASRFSNSATCSGERVTGWSGKPIRKPCSHPCPKSRGIPKTRWPRLTHIQAFPCQPTGVHLRPLFPVSHRGSMESRWQTSQNSWMRLPLSGKFTTRWAALESAHNGLRLNELPCDETLISAPASAGSRRDSLQKEISRTLHGQVNFKTINLQHV